MKSISHEIIRDVVNYVLNHSLREAERYVKEKHNIDVSYSTIQRWVNFSEVFKEAEIKELTTKTPIINSEINEDGYCSCGGQKTVFFACANCKKIVKNELPSDARW